MKDFAFSVQNIIDGNGISITITGMFIVFTALALISFFIAILPRLVLLLDKFFPAHDHDVFVVKDAPETSLSVTEETAAAIAFAVHMEIKKKRLSPK